VLVLLRVVPIVLTGFAFTLLYVTLPNRRVLLRDALTGGFLAALVFEAMKHGFALYITRIPTYTLVYGAFAAIPIFLIWIYLSWVVVLIGAVTAAVLPDWRERADQAEPPAGSQFLDALQILRVLRDARNADERVDERRLHGILKRPVDRIEAMLDEMKAAGWIERGRRGWQLARDLSGITVADIYHRFVFRGDIRLPARESGEALDRSALELAERLHEKLALPVEALFDSPPVS
jgi:membrane protein